MERAADVISEVIKRLGRPVQDLVRMPAEKKKIFFVAGWLSDIYLTYQ